MNAVWDDEVRVWVATSDEVAGLATEADDMEDSCRRISSRRHDSREGLVSFRMVSQSSGKVLVCSYQWDATLQPRYARRSSRQPMHVGFSVPPRSPS
ncbi:MAG: DUF1902 domain-containing protein [Gammaproteobacteria bacterium]